MRFEKNPQIHLHLLGHLQVLTVTVPYLWILAITERNTDTSSTPACSERSNTTAAATRLNLYMFQTCTWNLKLFQAASVTVATQWVRSHYLVDKYSIIGQTVSVLSAKWWLKHVQCRQGVGAPGRDKDSRNRHPKKSPKQILLLHNTDDCKRTPLLSEQYRKTITSYLWWVMCVHIERLLLFMLHTLLLTQILQASLSGSDWFQLRVVNTLWFVFSTADFLQPRHNCRSWSLYSKFSIIF